MKGTDQYPETVDKQAYSLLSYFEERDHVQRSPPKFESNLTRSENEK
jgi:hypothetical protein